MELAAALHHSRDVGPGTHAGLRAQKAASSGEVEAHETHSALRGPKQPPPGSRPGILAEPGPQRSDRSLRHSSSGAPSLALVSLAGGDAPDDATVTFLLSAALTMKKEEEEEERRKREEELRADEKKKLEARERKRAKALKGWDEEALWQLNRRIQAGSTLSSAEYAAWYYWDGGASSSSSKRKRKKKRKKKLPRASSHSSSGRARRRQRQWHVRCAGFAGDGTVRAVFPSVVVRPEVLDALAGMDQKDDCALIVSLDSYMFKLGFTGYDAPRVMFPSGGARPRMLSVMAGMDQKDSCSGLYKAGFGADNAPRAVFSSLVRCFRIQRNGCP